MAGIGIVINPHSRTHKRNPQKAGKLAYILGEHGLVERTSDAGDVVRVAEKFKSEGIEILALSGGDGTNHVTLSKFIQVYGTAPLPRIALLRGGTMNTIANGIGIRGNSHSILANLVYKYHQKQPLQDREVNLLCVNGDQYGFIFGNGLVQTFLDEYYATGNPSPWRAFTTFSRTVASALTGSELGKTLFKRVQARISVNGAPWHEGDYLSILAATVPEIGLGFRAFHRCEEQARAFHLIAIAASPTGLVAALPSIYRGTKYNPERLLDTVAQTVRFDSSENLRYTIDGDTHQSGTSITLETGPRIRVILH